VKINGAYYRDVVLRLTLLPDIRAASGSEFFVFQQVSAPSHCAKDTVALLDQETPNFIPPALWPPNSPDLNPVDYTAWNVLQERVYLTKISDVNSEWAALSHVVIEHAVGECSQRLRTSLRSCWTDGRTDGQTDRQTDRRTDGIAVAYTVLSIASRGKNKQ